MSVSIENLSAELLYQRDRLDALMRFWVPVLKLEHWSIGTNFRGERCDEDTRTNACVSCSWEYMQAEIDFYLPNFIGHDDAKAELIVVHELCHLLVNMMKRRDVEGALNLEERTVTHMAKAFVGMRRMVEAEKEAAA